MWLDRFVGALAMVGGAAIMVCASYWADTGRALPFVVTAGAAAAYAVLGGAISAVFEQEGEE